MKSKYHILIPQLQNYTNFQLHHMHNVQNQHKNHNDHQTNKKYLKIADFEVTISQKPI